MKEWVICKSCLYVMKKSGLKDKCPACGVPAKMFECYSHRISDGRRRLLSFDIHPIMVHFTQAFTASIPLLCILAMVAGSDARTSILACVTVIGTALPLVVVLTFAAGILDGKIRFRRIITPLLKTKIILSTALLLISIGIVGVLATYQPVGTSGLFMVLALSVPAVVCSSILGFIGARLVNSAFPG